MSDSMDGSEPDDRLAAAVGLYALDELTLGQAAERAGVSRFAFHETLATSSVAVRFGPESETGVADECTVARTIR